MRRTRFTRKVNLMRRISTRKLMLMRKFRVLSQVIFYTITVQKISKVDVFSGLSKQENTE